MWEVEVLLFWNRKKGSEEYLHVIRYKDPYNEDERSEWEGKIKSLKKKISQN